MTRPRQCNQVPTCQVRVVLAKRHPENDWKAYVAADVPPSTPGARVLIAGEAWWPQALSAEFQANRRISEATARDQVEGHPFHLPHFHTTEEREQS